MGLGNILIRSSRSVGGVVRWDEYCSWEEENEVDWTVEAAVEEKSLIGLKDGAVD